jgi:hypothetical protein
MKIACAIAVTVLMTVVLERCYGRYAAQRPKPDLPDDRETMDQQMNDGCQTSLRMIGFGVLSAGVVAGVIAAIGL